MTIYREFLLHFGNGGCGPGYGLQRFGDERLLATVPDVIGTGVMRDVVSSPNGTISVEEMVDPEGHPIDPFDVAFFDSIQWLCNDAEALRRPFPLTNSLFQFNREEPSQEEHEVLRRASDGTLALAHFGCGIYAILVVTGPQAGTVWVDDRTNGVGVGHFADYFPGSLFGRQCNMSGPHSFSAWYQEWLDAFLLAS